MPVPGQRASARACTLVLAAALAATTPALHAQESTRIVAATIFPDSASVERALDVPGGTRHVTIACVPASVDVSTLQVDGDAGVRVGDVQATPLPLADGLAEQPQPHDVVEVPDAAVHPALVGEVRRPSLVRDDAPIQLHADQPPGAARDVRGAGRIHRHRDHGRRRVVRSDGGDGWGGPGEGQVVRQSREHAVRPSDARLRFEPTRSFTN